jgi:hypothetical protein
MKHTDWNILFIVAGLVLTGIIFIVSHASAGEIIPKQFWGYAISYPVDWRGNRLVDKD